MESEPNEPILKALRSLHPDHPLRKQALAVLTDPMAPVPDIQSGLYELTHPSPLRKKKHTVAFWLITHANWSDAQRRTIAKTLSDAVFRALTTKRSSRAILRWLLRGIFVTFPFVLNIVCDGYHPLGPAYNVIDIIFCSVLALVLSLALTIVGAVITWPLSRWIDNLNLKMFCPAVEALGHVGPSAYIISLAEFAQDRSLRDVAAPALASVAARMRSED